MNSGIPYNGILLGNKKELLINTTTWVNLKKYMFSETSQTQKEYILY